MPAWTEIASSTALNHSILASIVAPRISWPRPRARWLPRINMTTQSAYLDGHYLLKNPAWHVEESPWKARQIIRMVGRNNLRPKRICDVGCGAGEVLSQLQKSLDDDC